MSAWEYNVEKIRDSFKEAIISKKLYFYWSREKKDYKFLGKKFKQKLLKYI